MRLWLSVATLGSLVARCDGAPEAAPSDRIHTCPPPEHGEALDWGESGALWPARSLPRNAEQFWEPPRVVKRYPFLHGTSDTFRRVQSAEEARIKEERTYGAWHRRAPEAWLEDRGGANRVLTGDTSDFRLFGWNVRLGYASPLAEGILLDAGAVVLSEASVAELMAALKPRSPAELPLCALGLVREAGGEDVLAVGEWFVYTRDDFYGVSAEDSILRVRLELGEGHLEGHAQPIIAGPEVRAAMVGR